jgi:hypothetical protein
MGATTRIWYVRRILLDRLRRFRCNPSPSFASLRPITLNLHRSNAVSIILRPLNIAKILLTASYTFSSSVLM